ncbi:hypothetical protein EDB80DRAFT_169625 [Ilyonectria destructans]|nr:hypothetical protein EDB80DRAFT_169625 [Ilyonectria destructans]
MSMASQTCKIVSEATKSLPSEKIYSNKNFGRPEIRSVVTKEVPAKSGSKGHESSFAYDSQQIFFRSLLRYPLNRKPQPKGWTLQAQRTLRRRGLTQRQLLERQISQGRPNPCQTWCGNPSCIMDNLMFENPIKHFVDQERSKHGLLVKDYYKNFVNAVVERIFPECSDPSTKARKHHAILSFVDSPPIKVALWNLTLLCDRRLSQVSDGDIQAELIKARPIFHDLMFGDKTAQTIETVHQYMSPKEIGVHKTWALSDLAVQFLIRAEVWRRHETCRSAEWSIGSSEHVAEFLTAMLSNYLVMCFDECLKPELLDVGRRWDLVWEDWLEKYPVVERQDDGDGAYFVTRAQLDETEEVVLETVGYLGGVGRADDRRNPIRQSLQK